MLTEGRPRRRDFPYWRVLVLACLVCWLAVVGAIAVVWYVVGWLT